MPRSFAIASLIAVALLLAASAHAQRLGKGRSLLTVAISGHRGQFVLGAGFGRYVPGEVGGMVAYDRFLSDHWTLGAAASYHASRWSSDDFNSDGTKSSTDIIDTYSYALRVGGDRYAFIDDNVALYAGPGLFLSRGREKDELKVYPPTTGGGSSEGPYSTEVGFNGRIGMYARLGRGAAFCVHIGQNLSRASGSNSSGESSWWSSTHEGALGLAFGF